MGICRRRAALPIAALLACGGSPVLAGDAVHSGSSTAPALAAIPPGSVEIVHFADRRMAPVRLVRGHAAPTTPTVSREVVSFGTERTDHVTVLRGNAAAVSAPVRQAALGAATRIQTVRFADIGQSTVTIVRGSAVRAAFSADLFGPASAGELDRVVFAVDGVESRHGADPGMWRAEPAGPQGPMQVSAAAALDVGGGNRFDLRQNRLLGRAYLARMFRRYGNWPDALAAYNWGPSNVDQWIAAGRRFDRMPLETVRYIERVLRDALITMASRL